MRKVESQGFVNSLGVIGAQRPSAKEETLSMLPRKGGEGGSIPS